MGADVVRLKIGFSMSRERTSFSVYVLWFNTHGQFQSIVVNHSMMVPGTWFIYINYTRDINGSGIEGGYSRAICSQITLTLRANEHMKFCAGGAL